MQRADVYVVGGEREADTGREGWIVPELPALPVEVAIEVVRYAQWCLANLASKVVDSV